MRLSANLLTHTHQFLSLRIFMMTVYDEEGKEGNYNQYLIYLLFFLNSHQKPLVSCDFLESWSLFYFYYCLSKENNDIHSLSSCMSLGYMTMFEHLYSKQSYRMLCCLSSFRCQCFLINKASCERMKTGKNSSDDLNSRIRRQKE